MSFGSLVFTNRGKVLQSKAQAGVQLNFTKIAMGDGELTGQSVLELTSLINKKIDISISSIKVLSGGVARIEGPFTNKDLATGFHWREIGLYAQDPDIGEILYCYANAGELAEYIPGGGSSILEKVVGIEGIVGNAQNVSAVIDSSIIFAKYSDIEEHNNNADAHPSIRNQINNLSNLAITSKPDVYDFADISKNLNNLKSNLIASTWQGANLLNLPANEDGSFGKIKSEVSFWSNKTIKCVDHEYINEKTGRIYRRSFTVDSNIWTTWRAIATGDEIRSLSVKVDWEVDNYKNANALPQEFAFGSENTIRRSLYYYITSGSTTGFPNGGILHVEIYNQNFCRQTLIPQDGSTVKYRLAKSVNTWGEWIDVQDSKKTNFTCLPGTGITIANSRCFKKNGEVVVNLMLKKTDGTAFPAGVHTLAQIPYSYASAQLNTDVIVTPNTADGWFYTDRYCTGGMSATGHLYASCSASVNSISISTRYDQW